MIRNFAEFQLFVTQTAMGHDVDEPLGLPIYAALGLGGESGEVLELIKKAYRSGQPVDRVKVAMECGDVLWYVGRLMDRVGLTIEDAANLARLKLTARNAGTKDPEQELRDAAAFIMARYTDVMR